VTQSNYHAKALVGQDLTFAVSTKTKVALSSQSKSTTGKGLAPANSSTRGIVKFRSALRVSNTNLLAALAPQSMTAFEVIAHSG
jgi:hypothetical protein